MNTEVKMQVVKALQEFATANNMNPKMLNTYTKVSISYLEVMLKGELVSGKTTIGDTHFRKVAKAIGYELDPVFWQHVNTPQHNMMLVELMDAKSKCVDKVFIGQSGCGKTYTLNIFKKKYPKHTYVVTVSSLHTLIDILDDICLQMNIEPKGNKVSKLRKLSAKVKELRLRGSIPILIIDEAENLYLSQLKAIKALYDAFDGNCPIVLIGTSQLQHKFEELKDETNSKKSLPQLYYRFSAGMRPLLGIDREKMYAPFIDLVDDEDLKIILYHKCNNYRELNKYIEPALREASEMGVPLTEKLFFQKNPQLV